MGAAPSTGDTATDALLDLVAWLPPGWRWAPVRPLWISVWDEAASSVPLPVWVEAGWFVAGVEPDGEPEPLGWIGCPREAVAALRRLFAVSASVADCADLSTDPLVMILEDFRDEGGRPAYTVAQVDGKLHVTLKRKPDGLPVTVRRDSTGYVLVYGETISSCANPEQAERLIRGSLIPSLMYA